MSHILERRRSALTGELLIRVGLAFAVISVLMLITNFQFIRAMAFPDPDDVMRMVQVRDLIAGQGWFDLTQHRVDAPHGGVAMHWSRLVDIPLASIIFLLTPLLGQAGAEMAAAVIVPLITFACALLLVARIAWRVVGGEAAGLACLSMALSVPLLAQIRPLRIDHHGWQIVLLLLAVNGLMARSPRFGGLVTGVALAAMLSISIEGLPLAAAICGIAALRWFGNRKNLHWFTHTMAGLAGGSAFIFLVTRGIGDLTPYCDAISPYHLGIFAVGAIGAWLLSRFEPMPRALLIGGLVVIAGAGGAIYALAARQCLAGPFSTLDPVVTRFWLAGIREGLPLWWQDIAMILQTLIPAGIAIWASMKLAGQSGGWLRRWWMDYTLLLIAALLVAIFVARAGAALGALAAVPIGWQIGQWLRASRNARKPSRRILGLVGAALVLLPALPLGLFAFAHSAQAEIGQAPGPGRSETPAIARAADCRLQDVAGALDRLPKGEIVAPLDIGPHILLHSGQSVVATGHHRASGAIRFQIDTFLAAPELAARRLRERGTSYVMMCPGLKEQQIYAGLAPDGLMAALQEGDVPGWLAPVAMPQGSRVKVWRIRADLP